MVFNRIDCLVRQSFFDSQGYVNKQKCRRHKVNFDLINKSVLYSSSVFKIEFGKCNEGLLFNMCAMYCICCLIKSPIVLLTTEDSAENCFKIQTFIIQYYSQRFMHVFDW